MPDSCKLGVSGSFIWDGLKGQSGIFAYFFGILNYWSGKQRTHVSVCPNMFRGILIWINAICNLLVVFFPSSILNYVFWVCLCSFFFFFVNFYFAYLFRYYFLCLFVSLAEKKQFCTVFVTCSCLKEKGDFLLRR